MMVECSSISLEGSAELRRILDARGVELLSAPVSGNAKVIRAGKLTFVVSGPKAAYDAAAPYLDMMGQGSSYVGEGELSRIVKICHNVMLGVVTQCMAEITVLAQKAGVPRHAFLDFLNKSVMGSTFTATRPRPSSISTSTSRLRRTCCARTWTWGSRPVGGSKCRCRSPR